MKQYQKQYHDRWRDRCRGVASCKTYITYLHLLSIKSLIYAKYYNTHTKKKKQTNKQTKKEQTIKEQEGLR